MHIWNYNIKRSSMKLPLNEKKIFILSILVSHDKFLKGSIRDVLNIDDVNSVFKIFYSIELVWKDIKVNFCYLKNSQQMNIVSGGKVWQPLINFIHEGKKSVHFNQVLFVEKLKKPYMKDDLESTKTCEEYKGFQSKF